MTKKVIACSLFFFVALLLARSAAPIDIDTFKKTADPEERAEMLRRAPPEQKEDLKRIEAEIDKIEVHKELVGIFHDERILRHQKERYVTRARGLSWLEGIFLTQITLWNNHVTDVWKAEVKAGKTEKEQDASESKIRLRMVELSKRLSMVHSLAFNLAPSPAALELNERCKVLYRDLKKHFYSNGVWLPMTRMQLSAMDAQVDQIFKRMLELPPLKPSEVQSEYEAFPEVKMLTKPSFETLLELDSEK